MRRQLRPAGIGAIRRLRYRPTAASTSAERASVSGRGRLANNLNNPVEECAQRTRREIPPRRPRQARIRPRRSHQGTRCPRWRQRTQSHQHPARRLGLSPRPATSKRSATPPHSSPRAAPDGHQSQPPAATQAETPEALPACRKDQRPARANRQGVAVTDGSARMAGQIVASRLFQSSRVRTTIVHRGYGLRACWVPVIFNHLFCLSSRPGKTGCDQRARPRRQRLSPSRHTRRQTRRQPEGAPP
jgi:hypothetical protein